jgi:hypothetical protein
MRLLCLFFPRLGIQLALRDRPQLRGRELLLLDGPGDEALVTTVSPEATAAGVIPGMSAGQARARCPRAVFLPDNAGECLDELERASSIVRLHATPLVAIAGRDHLFADLGGTAPDETALARSLARLVAAWTNSEVRAGVASTRHEARESARAARRGPLICPAAETPESAMPCLPPTEIVVSARLDPSGGELAGRAALVRLLGRLQTVLDARGESFRHLRLDIERPSSPLRAAARSRQPLHSLLDALALFAPQLGEAAFERASFVRLTLSRLGPDTRVRPCAAGRRIHSLPPAAALSLRAAG